MLGKLDGYKTYVLSVCGIICCACAIFGVIDWDTAGSLMVMLGFGGMATLRSGIANTK